MTNTSGKHLTISDRLFIEEALLSGKSFQEIAIHLEKHSTTIAKEVHKHRIADSKFKPHSNDCIDMKRCQMKGLCGDKECNAKCSYCKKHNCRKYCNGYASNSCKLITRAPYVCNGCNYKFGCSRPHFFYRASLANDAYASTLVDSRKGINLSPEQLYRLDSLISPLIKQGQSIAHIYASHKDEIPCSIRSIYTYIDSRLFSVRNLDLPRKVKYKPRKKKKAPSSTEYEYRIGRNYNDFQLYVEQNPDTNVVEMDTVIGTRKAGKVMLTMYFRNCGLMLIFLLQSGTQKNVEDVFDDLTQKLGLEVFKKLFPVILTDNGSEFKNPRILECTPDGAARTRIFFCDPQASWQKARIEKNHEYIRYIIPKGSSLEGFRQNDMTLMTNHINSVARASLNGRTPFELATLLLDQKLLKALRLKRIAADKVILKPQLLK
jgi:Transposase and inactivated derivatives, IS30 family